MFQLVGITLIALAVAPSNAQTLGLSGEVTIVESTDGTTVTVEHAQVREIAGQSFIGGKILSTEAKPGSLHAAGSRIWIASSEVVKITEFDTKAQFTAARSGEGPASGTTVGKATSESGQVTTAQRNTDIARIEDLGGHIGREGNDPNAPVTSIDLSRCQSLKDDDMRILSSFPELTELQLHGSPITDAGLKHVAVLTKLTYLGLINAQKITDAGMKELAGLQNLEELRIGNTGISDAGLKDLAQLKSLKMVGLLGTPMTEEGLKEFSEALPNMRHNRQPESEGGGGRNLGQRADPDFDVSIPIPAYADSHPSVLFDEAHDNFHTASGRYKVFADLMTNDGYQVSPNMETLSPERLAGHNVLIIANASAQGETPQSAFTDAECDAIEQWVKGGGSLLLVTDHEPFGSASEELGKRFGVRMSLQVANDPAHETQDGLLFSREARQLGNHPIMLGRNEAERVDRVLTFTGQSLKGPAGSAALLKFADTAVHHWDDRTAAGRSQGLALVHGKGRVVVMGEAGELSAQVYGDPPERMGMNVAGCDNRKMALNIMHWLSGLLEEASPSRAPPSTDSDSTPPAEGVPARPDGSGNPGEAPERK